MSQTLIAFWANTNDMILESGLNMLYWVSDFPNNLKDVGNKGAQTKQREAWDIEADSVL